MKAKLLIDLVDLEDEYPYNLKAGTIGKLSDTEADEYDYVFVPDDGSQYVLVNDNEVEVIEPE